MEFTHSSRRGGVVSGCVESGSQQRGEAERFSPVAYTGCSALGGRVEERDGL